MPEVSMIKSRMMAALNAMEWNAPTVHPVGGKAVLLKTAPATSAFWEHYRNRRMEWFRVGISTQRRGSQWYVKWWSNKEGDFTLDESKH